jgi:hypothetical protein
MKVAVCVSGAFRTGNPKGSLVRNNEIQKIKFPDADFYYATWEGYKDEFEKVFPNEKCEYFPEPTMHYHPYKDIDKKDHVSERYEATENWMKKGGEKRLEWSSHHTKQILIHAWLTNKIKDDYDIIIRTRFDVFISKNADFTEYLEDTYTNNTINCFGATKHKKFDSINEFDSSYGARHYQWLVDQLIIHTPDALSIDNVDLLHKQKMLHAAETGWYQVLSMSSKSNHRNHDGWVLHDKNVMDQFYY